jgi:hypothetical protein
MKICHRRVCLQTVFLERSVLKLNYAVDRDEASLQVDGPRSECPDGHLDQSASPGYDHRSITAGHSRRVHEGIADAW